MRAARRTCLERCAQPDVIYYLLARAACHPAVFDGTSSTLPKNTSVWLLGFGGWLDSLQGVCMVTARSQPLGLERQFRRYRLSPSRTSLAREHIFLFHSQGSARIDRTLLRDRPELRFLRCDAQMEARPQTHTPVWAIGCTPCTGPVWYDGINLTNKDGPAYLYHCASKIETFLGCAGASNWRH